jgi:UDP-sugar transporter A1/2/3
MIGVMAVLAMATLSGFSSVVLERVLKGTPSVTIWERNLQLGVCSVVLALLSVCSQNALPDVMAIASFQSGTTLAAATVSAFGGFLVALVMRYADNVVKCFATAVGICVTSALSVVLFGEAATRLMVLGIGLVVLSILNYNAEPPSTAAPSAPSSQPASLAIAESVSHVRSWKMAYIASLALGLLVALIWAAAS